jgi:hypothetical protein
MPQVCEPIIVSQLKTLMEEGFQIMQQRMVNEYTAASIAWQQQQAQQNVDNGSSNNDLVEPELAAEGFQVYYWAGKHRRIPPGGTFPK